MKKVKNNLKKQILFRSNYSGTKESDIIYTKAKVIDMCGFIDGQ